MTDITTRAKGWRTIELMVTALLGVACGVMFWLWNIFGWETLSGPLATVVAPLTGLLGGPWLLAGVLGGLVVRRPGAALFAEILAAAVSATLGTQWGWTVVWSGIAQGLGAELVFALFLYRQFTVLIAMLAGIVAAVFESVYEWYAFYAGWALDYKLLYMGFFAVSGAVVAGIGGWLLMRALAATGALDALPAGRELHHRRAV